MVKPGLERLVAITLMSLIIIISLILSVISVLQDDDLVMIAAVIVATFSFAAIMIAYLRGWPYAPFVLAALLTILPIAVLEELNPASAVACMVAPAVTIVFARAPWVLFSGLITITSVGIRDSITGFEFNNIGFFVIGVLVVVILAVARRVMDDARDHAIHQANKAEQARHQAEQANQEIQTSNQRLHEQTTQQQQLIELLNNLEVPAITLYENVLFIPVVGALDTRRAKRLMTEALESVHSRRAKMLILDIAGMPLIDTASARALTQAVEAVKLLGCTVIISGLRHDVALMLAEIQSEMPNVQFVQSLEDVFKLIS